MKQLLDFINKVSPIEVETFNELQKSFKPTQLKKGDFFIKEGKHAQQIGFLQKGIARAFVTNQEGKEYSKKFFIAPTIIGAYASLITKQPTKLAQQALTDCEILTIDYNQLEKSYDRFHDLERLGRKIAENYFLEKERKEIEMALLDADKRYLIFRERFPTIESNVPQYCIASYLGISPTQLSRIRRKFKDS